MKIIKQGKNPNQINHDKKLPLICLIALFLMGSSHAGIEGQQEVLSAGVVENFITKDSYKFDSDGMSRVQKMAFDNGFNSITAYLRLGVESKTSSSVYSPILRSSPFALETLAARLAHAMGELVLKPVVFQNPKLGTAQRLTDLRPENPERWLAFYRKALHPYVAMAATRGISELVLGVGLGQLWGPKFAQWWHSYAQEIRKKVGPQIRLSIELSSSVDLSSFREMKSENPETFHQLAEGLDRIRVTIPQESGVSPASVSPQALAEKIRARMEEVGSLFGDKPMTLSSIAVPACAHPIFLEDLVESCKEEVFPPPYAIQTQGLKNWFEALRLLPKEIRQRLAGLEFFVSSTDPEPSDSEVDVRHLLFNPALKDTILEGKKL